MLNQTSSCSRCDWMWGNEWYGHTYGSKNSHSDCLHPWLSFDSHGSPYNGNKRAQWNHFHCMNATHPYGWIQTNDVKMATLTSPLLRHPRMGQRWSSGYYQYALILQVKFGRVLRSTCFVVNVSSALAWEERCTDIRLFVCVLTWLFLLALAISLGWPIGGGTFSISIYPAYGALSSSCSAPILCLAH